MLDNFKSFDKTTTEKRLVYILQIWLELASWTSF